MSIDKKAICVGMMTCDSYYYDVDTDFLEKENSTASHIRMSAGGDATNVAPLEFQVMSNGKPVVTPAA